MTNLFKKTVIAAGLAATALAASVPAMAHDGYRHDEGGDGAGIAIGAGVVGLALGAIIASNSHHDRYDSRYDRDRGYYVDNGYYGRPYVQPYWVWRDGAYWDRDGHRYEGEYGRNYRGYERRGYGDNGYGGEYRHDGYRGYEGHYEGHRGY